MRERRVKTKRQKDWMNVFYFNLEAKVESVWKEVKQHRLTSQRSDVTSRKGVTETLIYLHWSHFGTTTILIKWQQLLQNGSWLTKKKKPNEEVAVRRRDATLELNSLKLLFWLLFWRSSILCHSPAAVQCAADNKASTCPLNPSKGPSGSSDSQDSKNIWPVFREPSSSLSDTCTSLCWPSATLFIFLLQLLK